MSFSLRPAEVPIHAWRPDLPAEWIPSEYARPNQIFYEPVHRYTVVEGDYPALDGTTYDGERHLLPLFDVLSTPPDALDRLLQGHDCLYPVPHQAVGPLQALGFRVDHNDADSDYVYRAGAFEAYRGRSLHAKRNLLHQFMTRSAPSCADLAGHEDSARAILSGWLADIDGTAAASDHDPCAQAIARHRELGMMGRITFTAEGEPAGFLIASRLGADCAVIHFAKGRRALNGVYPFLFSDFVRRMDDIRWLNFEQDLGNPRFRQNKRSFAPEHLITKYRVRPRRPASPTAMWR